MWQQRRWLQGFIYLIMIAWLSSCVQPDANQQPFVITFGASISITGKTAKEGEYVRDGYQFFVDTLNAKGGIVLGGQSYQLRLRYYDDESNLERTAELYEKLINHDQVDFLLGPYGSDATNVAVAIAEKYHIPLVSGHGSASSIYAHNYHYIFSVQTPARHYLNGVVDALLASDPSIKTVALLSETDSFSQDVAQGVRVHIQQRGLSLLYHGDYPSDARDVSHHLRAIKQLQPDVLLGAGHLQEALLIVKQAKHLDISPNAIALSVGPLLPQFRANLQHNADYILGPTQWTPALNYQGDDIWGTPAAFAQAFRQQYPHYKSVPYQVAESVASLIVFQRAFEQAGTLDRLAVRDTIKGLELKTFFGPIRFDQLGVNSAKPMAVEQLYPDGEKYTIFPIEVAEKPLLYPMPAWRQR